MHLPFLSPSSRRPSLSSINIPSPVLSLLQPSPNLRGFTSNSLSLIFFCGHLRSQSIHSFLPLDPLCAIAPRLPLLSTLLARTSITVAVPPPYDFEPSDCQSAILYHALCQLLVLCPYVAESDDQDDTYCLSFLCADQTRYDLRNSKRI